jgi:hypothetical protein
MLGRLDTEDRSVLNGGLDPDLATHEAHELARNGQAKTCSLVAGWGSDLDERLEDPLLILCRDAGAGVFHDDDETDTLRALRRAVLHPQCHAAMVSELDGIPDQVENHLPDLGFISPNRARNVRGHLQHQLQALRLCSLAHQLGDLQHQAMGIK